MFTLSRTLKKPLLVNIYKIRVAHIYLAIARLKDEAPKSLSLISAS